jgi:HPt (histidine-containing phosphotransfer) domain-containing protein
MTDRPIIDHDHLARYTLGDRALEREVLGLFVDQIPQTLEALDAAESDADRVRAAHTLKGSARAVGAFRLADIAERLERDIREGRSITGPRQELDGACREVRGAIIAATAA